jgi:hypothetical protein
VVQKKRYDYNFKKKEKAMNLKTIMIYFMVITLCSGFAEALTINGTPEIAPVFSIHVFGQSLELSTEQIQKVGQVKKFIFKIKDSAKNLIKGLFTSSTDSTGFFDIQTVAISEGINQLELTPISGNITSPGIYGNLNWDSNIDQSDWYKSYIVEYTSNGTVADEVVEVAVAPEPATVLLLSLGGLLLRRRK